jgi:hypothetical protein
MTPRDFIGLICLVCLIALGFIIALSHLPGLV